MVRPHIFLISHVFPWLASRLPMAAPYRLNYHAYI